MMRLVDADVLFKAYENIGWYNNADRDEIAEKILLEQPLVDAVEVVRCKDCVHYCKCYALGDSNDNDEGYMACDMGLGTIDDDWSVNDKVLPDDFCSRGERRKRCTNHL